MSSHILDRWTLELQQFNIKFNHIEGKKKVVADVISRLKTLNRYEKFQEVDPVLSVADIEDALENIIEESCSKLVISVTEHLVEVVDKLSTTTVVFFRSERTLKCKHLYGA